MAGGGLELAAERLFHLLLRAQLGREAVARAGPALAGDVHARHALVGLQLG